MATDEAGISGSHIRQMGFRHCGACCVAMKAGVSYERVLSTIPPDAIIYGLLPWELQRSLWKLTGVEFPFVELPERPTFGDFINGAPDRVATILRVERPEQPPDLRWHWVVTKSGAVYDPLREAATRYGDAPGVVREWLVVGYIR